MSEPSHRVRAAVATLFGARRSAMATLAAPLRADSDMDLSLSIPEAQTTTVKGDVGWTSRPPARVRCPRCGDEISQTVRAPIDCPGCRLKRPAEAFPDFELLAMRCPVCGCDMAFGRRHPNVIAVPEYATCRQCQYHWELEHF